MNIRKLEDSDSERADSIGLEEHDDTVVVHDEIPNPLRTAFNIDYVAIDTNLYSSLNSTPEMQFKPCSLDELENDVIDYIATNAPIQQPLNALKDHFKRTQIYGEKQITDITNNIIGKIHAKQFEKDITENAICLVKSHLKVF